MEKQRTSTFANTACAAIALSLPVFAATGCYTDSSGRLAFGRRPAGPTKEQLALQRLQQENSEMRENLRMLRTEVDGMGYSVNDVATRSDELSRATDARGQDAVALRNEVAALERRISALETKMANVSPTIEKATAAERTAIVAELNKALDGVNRQIAASEQRMQAEIKKSAQAARSSGSSGRSSSASSARRSGNYYEHIVASGQTLSLIAKEYGVSQDEIIAENGIKDPSRIRVGQTLYIPAP